MVKLVNIVSPRVLPTGWLLACACAIASAACWPSFSSLQGAPDEDDAGTPTRDGGMTASDASDGATADASPIGTLSYAQQVIADGPVVYWRLGEAQGTKYAEDQISPADDADYDMYVQLGVAGAIDGDPDTAARFVSSPLGGTCLNVDTAIEALTTTTFSIELWMRPLIINGTYRYAFWRDDGVTSLILFTESNGDGSKMKASLGNNDGGAPQSIAASQILPTIDAWNHVVVVADGTKLTLWLNDVIVDAPALGSSGSHAPALRFLFGCDNYGGSVFDGDLDEIAIYAHALDAETVDRHFKLAGTHEPTLEDAGAD